MYLGRAMDSTYPLVPVANFIAFFLAFLVMVTSHLRQSWRLGVCVFSAWISILALATGIETILWRDNADTTLAPALCDLSTSLGHIP